MTTASIHIHKNKKAVTNRLARIEGHIHAVKKMILKTTVTALKY